MKKILISIAALSLVGTAFAQEFDDFGGYEESAAPAVTINGEAGVKGRAWIGLEHDYTKKENIRDFTVMDGSAYGKLEFNYSADSSDVDVKFKVDSATVKENPEDILEEATARGFFGNWVISAGKMKTVWGKGDKLHVIDNFNANNYTDFIFPDYLDRRLAEPMISLAYSVPNASNIRIEGIVTPSMTADRMATSGTLVPAAQKNLTETVEGIIKAGLVSNVDALTSGGSASNVVSAIMGASSFSSDDLYEDNIKTIKYAQAGARMTGTLGSIDWGFSYYYGHYKQPSANLSQIVTAQGYDLVLTQAKPLVTAAVKAQVEATVRGALPAGTPDSVIEAAVAGQMADPETKAMIENISAEKAQEAMGKFYNPNVNPEYNLPLPTLAYDRLQTFGFELATVLWKFNTRAEVAYNLTEDTAGDNPWIKNNSIGWVVGFDMDLPIHNLNINVQNQGSYILKNDKIKDMNEAFREFDVDYNSDDKYTNNKLVINISDKWLNEKLTTECTTIYTIENKEWCVQPKIEYNAADGLFLTLSGGYLYSDNENGEFYNFTADATKHHRKGFGQVAVKYCF
ncbi:MAG: hypothetical protein KBT11_04200 [Treponema sp.]|nr:hypothetical protein [Candidatus Treponema equifaecale]